MSRRDLIRMTPDEVREFLEGRHTLNVATHNHDGTVHLVAMWYGFLDGDIAFETYAKSQKVQNLRRDPRITVLVEDGDQYENLRGVEMVGRAEIVEDHETIMEVALPRHPSRGPRRRRRVHGPQAGRGARQCRQGGLVGSPQAERGLLSHGWTV